MSEYQYYEFIAINEPLTPKQMAELRAYSSSSRANITPTSFILMSITGATSKETRSNGCSVTLMPTSM